MTAPRTSISADAAGLADQAADAFISRLLSIQGSGSDPSVVLTGGGIADEIHHRIATHQRGSGVAWDRIDFFWGDERFVAADSPDRNEGQARAALLDQLPVDPARLHPMPAEAGAYTGHPEAAAAAYASELQAVLGDRPFDIVMLGVGPDGHCASLFPGQDQVLATAPVVVVPESPKPPPVRLSLTLPRLSHADVVWFVASGRSKAAAVAAALDPDAEPLQVPSAGPRGRKETLWFLDQDSASSLS
ncbi:MAG: 6-phosphogluconolactonase [Marmoricola sp.]|nr:6-phosphogluconolactonase [Marmoricola sp.]